MASLTPKQEQIWVMLLQEPRRRATLKRIKEVVGDDHGATQALGGLERKGKVRPIRDSADEVWAVI